MWIQYRRSTTKWICRQGFTPKTMQIKFNGNFIFFIYFLLLLWLFQKSGSFTHLHAFFHICVLLRDAFPYQFYLANKVCRPHKRCCNKYVLYIMRTRSAQDKILRFNRFYFVRNPNLVRRVTYIFTHATWGQALSLWKNIVSWLVANSGRFSAIARFDLKSCCL